MKKFLLITLICIVAIGLLSGTPRNYTQKVINSTTADGQLPGVTCPSTETSPNYTLTAWITARPYEVLSTDGNLDNQLLPGPSPASTIRVYRYGNGTTMPYRSCINIQLGSFTTPWVAGDILHVEITYLGSLEGYSPVNTFSWEMTIPTGTAFINYTDETLSQIPIPNCPPYPAPTHNLTVESNYVGAEIYKDGTDTGFTTPSVFTEAGTYTVQLAGVTEWTPAEYVWDGTSDQTIRFMGVKTPNAVNAVYPPDGQIIHIAWNAPATAVYTLQWAPDPNPAAVAPDHYIVKWMGAVQTTVEATVTSWDTPAIGEGTYNWEIIPVVTDPAKGGRRTLQPVRATIANNAKGNGPSEPWTFTIQRDYNWSTSVNGLPEGAIVGPDNITLSWNIDSVMPPDGFFKVYEDANNPPTTLIYTGTDTEFTISDPLSPGTYYWFVELHNTAKALLGTSGIRSFIVQNVPVELTSFDAAITSEM